MNAGLPRRVLMTADAVGGVWTYALTLAAGLADHGIGTTLAVIGPAPAPDQAQAARALGLRLEQCDARLEWMPGADAEFARSAGWLRRLADSVEPDLVHINGYCHAALDWPVPCVVAAHSCVASWWQAVHGAPPPADYAWYCAQVRRGLAAADLVLAPTAAFLAALEACHGRVRRPCVVPNGTALGPAEPVAKDAAVLAAGRLWDPAKNLAVLDAAAARCPWPVMIAGDPSGPSGAARPLRHARALGRIPAAALRAWMARAEIFALPARYEPFGLAILEAALESCALVLGDIPTLRELWHGCALFVDPDDTDALAAALTALAGNRPLCRRLGRHARERAQSFGADRMVAGTLAAYRSATAPRAAARAAPQAAAE